jgi:predicted amidohydrolase
MQADAQTRTVPELKEALSRSMEQAATAGADVLITPELFLSGYGDTADTARYAQEHGSEVLQACAQLAAQNGIALVLGYPERGPSGLFNSAIVFDRSGEVVCNYRKVNLPNDYERGSFQRGRAPAVFEIAGVRCSVLICYDIEFPEMARSAVEMGAELLLVPTALGPEWRIVADSLVPVRAYENGVFVAYCNFAASSLLQEFAGLSTVCGPDGQALVRAGLEPGMFTVTIDTAEIARIRSRLTFLADLKLMRASR